MSLEKAGGRALWDGPDDAFTQERGGEEAERVALSEDRLQVFAADDVDAPASREREKKTTNC